MKKTLLATLVAALLVLSAFAIAIPASAASDYIIFGNGAFGEGGEILDGCGTIIEDGYLVGGEGINNGQQGAGWFQIKIDGSGNKDAWTTYKYLRIVGAPYKCGEKEATGAYNGGTVQFGAGNTYNFDQLEVTGKKMNSMEKEDCYILDLSKVTTFEANWFLMSHSARGYKIKELALTDSPEYTDGSSGGDGPVTNAPATDAPATDAPATDAPATDAPATDAPATDAPATDAPATDAPATDAPATDAPATTAPTGGIIIAPTTNTPATLAPTQAPTSNNPKTDVAGIGVALAVAGLAAAGLVIATKKSK